MTCRRCGACCQDGGPALHHQDLGLLTPDPGGVRPHLDIADLMVLRRGEVVRDQPQGGGLTALGQEIIKIRGRDGGWTCMYYDDGASACGRYAWRPQECRRQDCEATQAIAAFYERDRLTRFDIMPEGGRLAELAYAHEDRCHIPTLVRTALAYRRGEPGAGERILHMLAFDHSTREVLEQMGGAAAEAFVFGQPLHSLLRLFGLALETGSDGKPALAKVGLWQYPDPDAELPASSRQDVMGQLG